MPKERFFYTTDTPHKPTSGPDHWTWDLERNEYIASLERAKELAEEARMGRSGQHCYTRTTYGTFYKTEDLEQ